MWDLCIYASITEHDAWIRRDYIDSFKKLGVEPIEKGDKLEIKYEGNRATVLQIAAICEECRIHHVHVSRPEY